MPGSLENFHGSIIKVRGSSRTTFLFPGSLKNTIAYFTNYQKVFSNLPHIRRVKSGDNSSFCLKYETLELGVYRVEIECDVQVTMEQHKLGQRMIFEPINPAKPTKNRAGLHNTAGGGCYQSESIFEAHDQQTVVHFSLQLFADLPCPWGLLVVPPGTRNRITHSITNYRIHEITNGFVRRSIIDFQSGAGQA